MTSPRSLHRRRPRQSGIVLPIALIMLVIISFAGLLAARRSANFEMFSNNMRTNQVARVAAEDALRQCERVAQGVKNGETGGAYDQVKTTDPIAEATDPAETDDAIQAGIWNTKTNWADGAGPLIIPDSVTVLSGAPQRSCIVEAMAGDRYLITARGLSNDAVIDSDTGMLTFGSEVWLQSILTPAVPELDDAGGVK